MNIDSNNYFDLINNEIEHGAKYFDIDYKSLRPEIRLSPNYKDIYEVEGREKAEFFLERLLKLIDGCVPLFVEKAFSEAIKIALLTEIEEIKDKLFLSSGNKKEILEREEDRYQTIYTSSCNEDFIVEQFSINDTIKNVIYYTIWQLFSLSELYPENQNQESADIKIENYIRASIIPQINAWAVFEWINSELKKIDALENETEAQLKKETIAEKITRILEPLRAAFDKSGQIDIISVALIKLLNDEEFPANTTNRRMCHIGIVEFLRPFRQLIDEKIIGQRDLSTFLAYFISKNCEGENYSQSYFNRMLKPNNFRKS